MLSLVAVEEQVVIVKVMEEEEAPEDFIPQLLQ
jgi:hypothetical protein